MIVTVAAPCVVTPPAGADIYVIINIVYVLLSLGPYAGVIVVLKFFMLCCLLSSL